MWSIRNKLKNKYTCIMYNNKRNEIYQNNE